jgi:hypothetical protein
MKTTMEGRAKAAGKEVAAVREAARVAIPAQRFGNAEAFGAGVRIHLHGAGELLSRAEHPASMAGTYPGTF